MSMKKDQIKKILIFDGSNAEHAGDAFCQCMSKMRQLFTGSETEFIRLCTDSENPLLVTDAFESEIRRIDPDIVIVPATALGEEVAPALGIRFGTGVAAHCSDILVNGEGRVAYMVPAFGGKVIGEIFIPDTRPAIATVKPGVFPADERGAGGYSDVICRCGQGTGDVELLETVKYEMQKNPIEKADIIFCGGFGIGSAENWEKLEKLAEITGGAAGCTRPVVDMGWGPDEQSMIGTSGKTVRPKLYVGFGISGAAHHLCGISDSGIIVNVNSDGNADCFAASDYTGEADASKVIDCLLEKLG